MLPHWTLPSGNHLVVFISILTNVHIKFYIYFFVNKYGLPHSKSINEKIKSGNTEDIKVFSKRKYFYIDHQQKQNTN